MKTIRPHRQSAGQCGHRRWRQGETAEPVRPYPRWRRATILLALVLLAPSARTLVAQEPGVATLRSRIAQLNGRSSISIAGSTVRRSEALIQAYERRGFALLWTDAAGADLLRAIRSASEDGLDPEDYHLRVIESLGRSADRSTLADLDVLMSDALLLLLNDLRFGKLDAADPAAGRVLRMSDNSASELVRIARSGRVAAEVRAIRPNHYIYRGLTAALSGLKEVESAGGWPGISSGPTLKVGDGGPRVEMLRRRLAGEMAPGTPPPVRPDSFDRSLEDAVRSFQHRHGLNEDGVVGPATLAELNVPVANRIRQVRINLERARWIIRDLPATFVAVNIAGAKVYFVRNGTVVYESRAVVGQTSTRTPIFRATMSQIDLNPTWTVPPGIVGEVLADVRRDPAYMARVGMNVIDQQGRIIDISPAQVAGYSARSFPYVFRQAAGPLNPLGQVKFVFPNAYNVYLHDTPSRTLFEREQRTFSHGCIRLQNPLDLAVLILNDAERWSRTDLLEQIATGRTRTISLATPVPVLVLYWTASADLHGELHFYRDAYGRDEAVLRGLDR